MNLSQEEIDALMNGTAQETDSTPEPEPIPDDFVLGPVEIDILGEVGNMCMGAVATTMYTLLDRPVSITTPKVTTARKSEVLAEYDTPFVVAQVNYTEGVSGSNLLILKESDAALITDLLMGGDGNIEEPVVLDEMHMSAVSEVMNQMMGASATALSKLLGAAVNISTPQTEGISQDDDMSGFLEQEDIVVKISFDMVIEDLLQSELLQLMPFGLAKSLSDSLIPPEPEEPLNPPEPEAYAAPPPPPAPPPPQYAPPPEAYAAPPPYGVPPEAYSTPSQYASPPYGVPPMYAPPPPMYAPPPPPQNAPLVNVHNAQYPSFDQPAAPTGAVSGMNLIHDIQLNVTVELGRTKREINDILKFGMGTIVVLDKTVGDPVEVFVNGKLLARGEVVVIEDSYGVRITEIING
ncbi:MAG: flagellar motor switch phosphatase FliY [Oscillospiraceae bacterium]|jgi:flagellar motor switch protein FliN/FliY|nr:flagellar motor switch phosphatase FliY [Oscillospiraceae bacterium]